MELMCPCLLLPLFLLVRCVGDAVGSLERLHHLLLPGCRRPVQGETLFFHQVSVRPVSTSVSHDDRLARRLWEEAMDKTVQIG